MSRLIVSRRMGGELLPVTAAATRLSARRVGASGRMFLMLIPVAAAFWMGACFVWNHFLNGPYLLDSGWFSAVGYRQGLLPDNPPCAHPLREYFGVHLSPLLSLSSLLSYVLPVDRVQYYCLFQGLIYAPLGAVTALLARADGAAATWRGAFQVLGASLLFALNGEVLSCVGYPHFEIFAAVGLCVMLVGISSGKARLAWLGLALTGLTREDGGLHALAFVLVALVCSASGRPLPLANRVLARMAVVAASMSIAAILAQKLFFESAGTFRNQFVGDPAFGHLTLALLQDRLLALPLRAGFAFYPMVGTLVIALLARDARYLLGWVAELPWVLICLLALSEGKASLGTYNGFPFVASIFWVGAYGRLAQPIFGSRPWLLGLAAVSALSTLGGYISHPNPFLSTVRAASIPSSVAYRGIAQFSSELERGVDFYDRVLVDPGVASWAIAGMPKERCIGTLMAVASPQSYEGIAFFRRGFLGGQIRRFIEKSPFSQCGRIPTSDVFLCTRPSHVLPSPFVAESLDG